MRSVRLWERDERMTTLITAVIAVVLALASTMGLSWPWLTVVPTSIAYFLVAVILYRLLILSPMQMWKEQRDKALAYETTNLLIEFDDANASCKRDQHLGDDQLGERLWRVGIKGSGGHLMNGVVVQLVAIEPSVDDLPQALHPMNSPWQGQPTDWKGDGSFDIRPGATEYVDVIRYRPSYGQESDRLEIVLQSRAKTVPFRTQTLTLSAQGREGPCKTRRFQVEVNPKGLTRFYSLDVSAS